MIYILELEDNKYYVGFTTNLEKRLQTHKKRLGTSWTVKYKFIKIHEIIENGTLENEDYYTKKYMEKFGVNNVRGGTYTRIYLNGGEIEDIYKEFRTNNGSCFRCG